MKRWIAAAIALLAAAAPARAQQSPPFNVELGTVMGIIAQPYVSVGVGPAPWLVRVSGGGEASDCYGVQANLTRTVRDAGNAKHSVGLMWATFRNGCWYSPYTTRRTRGQYAGFAYDFQVKGFFVEVGPGFGARNPVLVELGGGPGTWIYGQIGYVHRFGKKYVEEDEEK